jgi:hypothetical protein
MNKPKINRKRRLLLEAGKKDKAPHKESWGAEFDFEKETN